MRHWDSPAAVMWPYGSKHTQSWGGKQGPHAYFSPFPRFISSLQRALWTMDSNLNPVTSFIIPMMRHWDSPAAVMWP
eukprot:scaffold175018_cov36-Cyclotella_meneghiniana.AAC.1